MLHRVPCVSFVTFLLLSGETGFIYVCNGLRDRHLIDAVYDLTLAYYPKPAQSEFDVFANFPKRTPSVVAFPVQRSARYSHLFFFLIKSSTSILSVSMRSRCLRVRRRLALGCAIAGRSRTSCWSSLPRLASSATRTRSFP